MALTKSLSGSRAGQAFEALLKSGAHEDGVVYGSPSGARKEASLEHDAPWLVNGAKYKVIKRKMDTAPYQAVGESHALFNHPDHAGDAVHTAKIPEIAERVYREGHAIVTSRGGKNAVPKGANHPNHPDHAAYEYHHAVQILDPAREFNRLHEAKKSGAAGAMTEGSKQLMLDEGVGQINNQFKSHLPTHMAQIVHGDEGQFPHGDIPAYHMRDTVIKMKRGASRQAWWSRALHHLASNPDSEAPGRESAEAHPDLSKFSTRAHVLYHARKNPGASFEDLHTAIKPLAADDRAKNGKSRRVVLGVWKKHPQIGHVFNNPNITSSSDAIEHLATLPVKEQGQKHEALGVDYVTPTVRDHIDDHLKTFHSDHSSLSMAPQAKPADIVAKLPKGPKKTVAPPTLGPPGSH